MIRIPLTKKQTAIVDEENKDLSLTPWCVIKSRANLFYAVRAGPLVDGKRKLIYMHRVVLERKLARVILNNYVVDHIDGNTLNNVADNLREAPASSNQQNRNKQENNSSGFKGVSFNKKAGNFYASIQSNGVKRHLGSFGTAEAAALAYNTAALKFHGEFAKINKM